MKQRLFIITLLFSFNTIAQDSYKDIKDYEVPIGTVSLCKEKDSTGYNWKNREWVKTNYKPEELIIRKIPYKDIDKSEPYMNACADIDNKKNIYRCYSVKSFGEEDSWSNNRLCREQSYDNKLLSVVCEFWWGTTTRFLPNGLFVRTHLIPDLDSEIDKKDSMMLSHGLCGTIN